MLYTSGMTEQTITLKDRGLSGVWHHGNRRDTLIILCHGINSSHKHPSIMAIELGLNKHSYDTFGFNFTKNLGGFDVEHQVDDIRNIIEHFRDYKRIILLAASFSALTTAIVATEVPGVHGLITVNGFFGTSALGKSYRNTYIKFRAAALVMPQYHRILRYYKTKLRPAHIDIPVLVIHSPVDTDVSDRQSRMFYKRLRSPKRFVELNTSNHGITRTKDREFVVQSVHEWIKDI